MLIDEVSKPSHNKGEKPTWSVLNEVKAPLVADLANMVMKVVVGGIYRSEK